jgi:hypothetical protein
VGPRGGRLSVEIVRLRHGVAAEKEAHGASAVEQVELEGRRERHGLHGHLHVAAEGLHGAAVAAPAAGGGGDGRRGRREREVGLGLGAAVLASGGVIHARGFLGRVVRAEPHPALLGRVADLRREPAPRPLPNTPVVRAAGSSAERQTGGRGRRLRRFLGRRSRRHGVCVLSFFAEGACGWRLGLGGMTYSGWGRPGLKRAAMGRERVVERQERIKLGAVRERF